ncbi:MAG: SIS domain-containing protein [Anaerolineae bacterium]|nr:SIS domain-containing protein [Anaerolineae bacterium]
MLDLNNYIARYLEEVTQIAAQIDQQAIKQAIDVLRELRQRQGRLFILGVGGSAGNASHAVNDFRKIAGMETYAPTDNVSELTAWVNDVSWEAVFANWLQGSHLHDGDALLIFSVGGGSSTTSLNLVRAMEYGKSVGSRIIAVVSRDGGMAKQLADVTILVPVVSTERITPHAESWQAVVWHLIVNALATMNEGE